MMISPKAYRMQFKKASYEELIEERDRLIHYLQEYERLEKNGDRTGSEWNVHPQPNVRYQVYMDYLAELLPLMRDKYNREYVCGEKSLCQQKQRGESV